MVGINSKKKVNLHIILKSYLARSMEEFQLRVLYKSGYEVSLIYSILERLLYEIQYKIY